MSVFFERDLLNGNLISLLLRQAFPYRDQGSLIFKGGTHREYTRFKNVTLLQFLLL